MPLARAVARQQGLASLPVVALPHPLGGRDPGELAPALEALVDRLGDALTTAPAEDAEEERRPRWRAAPTDPEALLEASLEGGWGDGLPLVPPTRARIEAMLAAADLPPDRSLGPMPPANDEADVFAVAANAVLAGCRPEHLPVVLAAVRAVLEPRFNLKALQSTTHPVTPLVIVHGEAVTRLGFNPSANVLGQGNRSNAAVGRAVRLVLQNVGGARPGSTDRATHGTPAKYAYCMAELPDAGPWPPLHAERGVDGAAGAVTVVGAEAPHNVNDHGSDEPEGLLGTIADTLAVAGSNNLYLRGQPLLILSPEHAALLARDGATRADVQAAVHARASVPVDRLSAGNLRRFRRIAPELFDPPPDDGLIPMLDRPSDLLVVVAGGPGKHSMVVPTFGTTDAVTVALDHPA